METKVVKRRPSGGGGGKAIVLIVNYFYINNYFNVVVDLIFEFTGKIFCILLIQIWFYLGQERFNNLILWYKW